MVTDKGDGSVNEDHASVGEDYALVLDGATPINKIPIGSYDSQAAWFAHFFAEKLQEVFSEGDLNLSPASAFREAARRIVEQCPEQVMALGDNGPSLTFALVHCTDATIDIFVLGDCVVYVKYDSGEISRFTDDRVQKFSEKTVDAQEAGRKLGTADLLVREQRLENRKHLNKAGGYWVVNLGLSWVEEIQHMSALPAEVSSILICTDGFDRAFSLYRNISIERVLDGSVTLGECVQLLRSTEEADEAIEKFPRMKSSDDCSAVILFAS